MSSLHIDELLVAKYLDGELEAGLVMDVRNHLDSCEACRRLMAETESALRAYQATLRLSAPAPPRPWADLRPRLNELDAEPLQMRARPSATARKSPWWWAAAAASVAIGALVIRLTTSETVSAAELLEKASAREVREAPAKRVRIRTARGQFIRGQRDPGDARLAAMFQNANFDWNDPLRASAFAAWRQGLSEKSDEVRILENPSQKIGRFFRIRTTTPTGDLREVSITLRAGDLRAIEERFEFRNSEWVEISEAPAEVDPAPSLAGRPDAPPAPQDAVEERATLGDEVLVYAALHKIGADLGEPIEVRRDDKAIHVTVLGASARREREIREALSALPNTTVTFEQPPAVAAPTPGASTEESPAGPLQSRLLSLMGSSANVETFTNRALEESESVMARAHAIRRLSERFGAGNHLESGERDTLRSMEKEHARSLQDSVKRLESILEPLLGTSETNSSGPPVNAQQLLTAAQRLDTLLSVALASAGSADDPETMIVRLRQALGELGRASQVYAP